MRWREAPHLRALILTRYHLRRALATQEARHHAVLTEMETVLKEPPRPPEPPEAQGPGGS